MNGKKQEQPELVVNVNGTFDNMVRERGFDNTSTTEIPVGTEWNEWQDQWTGNPRTNTITKSGNRTLVQTTREMLFKQEVV